MKLLHGSELAGFIKARQAGQVRTLRQAHHVQPKLSIISTIPDHSAIEIYMRMKQRYGSDIGIDVDIHRTGMDEVAVVINSLNEDEAVHGIIVQLPLAEPGKTDVVTNLVAPNKDVDGLSARTVFEPATPMAIMWLLAGHNINVSKDSRVVVFGRGKLVGRPLAEILESSGVPVDIVDTTTSRGELIRLTKQANTIISGVGKPGLITTDLIPADCVVIDAGVASEGGKTVGDVDPDVYDTRDDIKITPLKGGVGPLTVCALFENVIKAASSSY